MSFEIDDEPPIKLWQPTRRDHISRPLHYRAHPTHLSIVELRYAEVHLGIEQYTTPVGGLIVGENPGPNSSWATPLFPFPASSSAGRLLDMSALDAEQYLGGLYRRNLCDAKWNNELARIRARAIITALFDSPRSLRVVLCGVKVAEAFEVRFRAGDYWRPIQLDSRQTAVVIPHPSGVNRIYNDREARLMTGAWMRWAALGEDHP
jgi:hypothetical protein